MQIRSLSYQPHARLSQDGPAHVMLEDANGHPFPDVISYRCGQACNKRGGGG